MLGGHANSRRAPCRPTGSAGSGRRPVLNARSGRPCGWPRTGTRRFSAPSMKISRKLAVATSLLSSQSACALRMCSVTVLLSCSSSASMSRGETNSFSLSFRVWIWPISRSTGSSFRRSCARARRSGPWFRECLRLLVEQLVIVAKVRAAHMPVEILGLDVERVGIRQIRFQRAEISFTASAERSVGVSSAAETFFPRSRLVTLLIDASPTIVRVILVANQRAAVAFVPANAERLTLPRGLRPVHGELVHQECQPVDGLIVACKFAAVPDRQ